MKQISKKDWERLQAYSQPLQELKAKLESVIDEAQQKIEAAISEIEEKRGEVHAILDDLASEAQNYYDERSDKWRDGDAGSEYQDWISNIEAARDTYDNELSFEIDASSITDSVDEMINQLDGELNQAPNS